MTHGPRSLINDDDAAMDALEAKIAPLIEGQKVSVIATLAMDMLVSALLAQDHCYRTVWLEQLIVGLREELHWRQLH